jgi:RNA polymerase sigma-54 factor
MPNQTIALTQEQRLHMVLAPQLRQSLEVLQAPILELRAMVRAELDRNPTLEEVPASAVPLEIEPTTDNHEEENKRLDFRKEFEILARLDDEWRDYFFQEESQRPYTAEDAERRQYFFDSFVQNTSLQEHLLNQLALAELQESDRKVGELLIGSLNDDGYLAGPLEELAASASVDLDHLLSVLSVIQEFDPPGVGARDLRECLLLQLERLGKRDTLAARIVQDQLESLGARKYPELARVLKVTVEAVQTAVNLIATLDPKPGRAYSGELSPYVTPEIIVDKVDGEYIVMLNDDQLPRVRISKHYRSLMNDAKTGEDVRKYIQEKVRSGAFLIKSIHQRQHTIYRIACEIVRVQRDFFDLGVAHLKPLVMADVAAVVGLHETTVSRAVAGKHMQTPRGVFEMKFFFTPGLRTEDGSVMSNKAVQDMIASLIGEEDSTHPLSDQDIWERLKQRGISIARRTIAKYRIGLRIPPSHQRKKY